MQPFSNKIILSITLKLSENDNNTSCVCVWNTFFFVLNFFSHSIFLNCSIIDSLYSILNCYSLFLTPRLPSVQAFIYGKFLQDPSPKQTSVFSFLFSHLLNKHLWAFLPTAVKLPTNFCSISLLAFLSHGIHHTDKLCIQSIRLKLLIFLACYLFFLIIY